MFYYLSPFGIYKDNHYRCLKCTGKDGRDGRDGTRGPLGPKVGYVRSRIAIIPQPLTVELNF